MLEQDILPTVFEKNSKIGGVWPSSVGNTWKGMQTNVTRYMCCFSDFPLRNASNDLFPFADEMCEYLQEYADHFKVTPHIQVNSIVTYVTQIDNEKWLVKWQSTTTGDNNEQVFDFVVLASGMYTTPYVPTIDGQTDYNGKMIHSKHYNSLKSQDLKGKTILTVGASYSATEISSDLVQSGAHVVNLFRKPYWVFSKVCSFDPSNSQLRLPFDYALCSRRDTYSLPKFKSIEEENLFKNNFFASLCKDQNNLDQTDLHIDPNSTDCPNESISNNYIELVKQQRIVPKKGEIRKFLKNGVELVDGTFIQVDGVVWCTGYNVNLDFVDRKILDQLEYDPSDRIQPLVLYWATFRPEIKNIAFVGMLKEPIYTVDELQGRWASLVFSGKKCLPDQSVITKHLDETRKIKQMKTKPQALDANYTLYSDELAKEIGLLPDFERIKDEDPELYKMMWDGLPVSAQYRYNENKEFAIQITKEAYQIRRDFLEI